MALKGVPVLGVTAPKASRAHHHSGDQPTVASTYTSAQLQARILELLADGPQRKIDLHRALGVNEARLYTELQALRRAGKTIVVGRRLLDRKWALPTYRQEPLASRHEQVPRQKFPRPLEERYADLFRA